MSKKKTLEETYKNYKDYIEGSDGNGCTLITTLDEFRISVKESKKNKTWKQYRKIKLDIICSCGYCFNKDFACFTNSLKKCEKCVNIERGSLQKITKEELVERLSRKGLTYVSGEYKNSASILNVQCVCGNIFQTSYASIHNSCDNIVCKICFSKKVNLEKRISFEEIRRYYEDNQCKLISLEDEYINAFSKLRFIARCGHEYCTTVDSFKRSKHKMCLDCTKKINSGEKAYNWNGGYDSKSEKFRKTYEFKKWHKDILKRDRYTCQCCGNKSGELNVHHLDGYNWCEEKRTDIDNGITLCRFCHEKFHSIYGKGNNTKEQYEDFIIEDGVGKTIEYSVYLN